MKDKFEDKDDEEFFISFGLSPFKFHWKNFNNIFNDMGRSHPWFSLARDKNQFRNSSPYSEIQKDNEGYIILLELPGVSRDEINLEITSEELWLEAKSEEYERRYKKHLFFKNPINVNETRATLKSGILKIKAPFEKKIDKAKVKID